MKEHEKRALSSSASATVMMWKRCIHAQTPAYYKNTLHNSFLFFFISHFRCVSLFVCLNFIIIITMESNAMLLLDLIQFFFFVVQFECQFQLLSVIWCILAKIWFSLCSVLLFFALLLSLSIHQRNNKKCKSIIHCMHCRMMIQLRGKK